MVGVWCNLSAIHTVKEGKKGTGKHTCSRQMMTKAQKGKKNLIKKLTSCLSVMLLRYTLDLRNTSSI